MSRMASPASRVSVPGSIVRNSRPAARVTPTPSVVTHRYSVWVSGPSGSTSVCWNAGVTLAAVTLAAVTEDDVTWTDVAPRRPTAGQIRHTHRKAGVAVRRPDLPWERRGRT